ncbi:hypothetical protein [Sulfurimonas sp. NWX367]|uniref:hypothetical protein n=1 Tax=unclassified Sulfurimonas TaxID=2623549 RepID=UPI0032048D58
MSACEEINTDIVLIDIINFSMLTIQQQFEIINFLTRSYKKIIQRLLESAKLPVEELILGYIPTGDGFYCILTPKFRGYGTILGLSFHHFSEQLSKKFSYFHGLRIAVHTGKINKFTDILGHQNFIGTGLNDCARYLEIKDFSISTVMISHEAYYNFKRFISVHKEYNQLLQEREFKKSTLFAFQDKHGNEKKGYRVWLRKSGIIIPPIYKGHL